MSKNVVVYSSNSCGFCTLAKNYLNEKGVKFVEKNLGSDPAALDEFKKLNLTGVPVILIDDETVVGFDRPKIDRLLNL